MKQSGGDGREVGRARRDRALALRIIAPADQKGQVQQGIRTIGDPINVGDHHRVNAGVGSIGERHNQGCIGCARNEHPGKTPLISERSRAGRGNAERNGLSGQGANAGGLRGDYRRLRINGGSEHARFVRVGGNSRCRGRARHVIIGG